MIAVTFALKSESADFIRLLGDQHTAPKQHTVTGTFAGHGVAVLHTGVGRIAESRVWTFLSDDAPDLLISAGFAGALHDGWRAGELLLAQNFSSRRQYELADVALTGIAKPGKLHTDEHIVDSAAARAEVAQLHGADAVDMETALIAEACAAKNTPILALRAISDTPASPFPAPPAVLFDMERQRTNLLTLGFHVAKNPTAVVKLIRFAAQFANARAALAAGLERLLQERAFVDSYL